MMREMVDIVAHRYKGSLKGEHSTGRNISPFVEEEWGEEAFSLMWEVKMLFDPAFMLNPGVIVTPGEPPASLHHIPSLHHTPSLHHIPSLHPLHAAHLTTIQPTRFGDAHAPLKGEPPHYQLRHERDR
jgi:hypothetical protein